MTQFLYRLGRAAVRNRRRVVFVWIAFAIAAVVGGQTIGGEQKASFSVPGVEAQKALDVLRERFPSAAGTSAQVVFAVQQGSLADAGAAAVVADTAGDIAALADVTSVSELRSSPSGAVGFVEVQYSRPVADIKDSAYNALKAVVEPTRDSGVQVELGGDLPTEGETSRPEARRSSAWWRPWLCCCSHSAPSSRWAFRSARRCSAWLQASA